MRQNEITTEVVLRRPRQQRFSQSEEPDDLQELYEDELYVDAEEPNETSFDDSASSHSASFSFAPVRARGVKSRMCTSVSPA